MEQPLVLLVSLVLLSLCRGEWTPPDFCHQQQCPEYRLIEKNQVFEKRFYVGTKWITTKVESISTSDVLAAHSRLKNYYKKQNDAGYNLPSDTWPVLITIGHDFSLSWFVPPDTIVPENTDQSVTLESRPEGIVYVRVFGGTPSIERGQENTIMLWNALDKNCTDLPTHSGAGYDSFFSPFHHNEIWIYADNINCK